MLQQQTERQRNAYIVAQAPNILIAAASLTIVYHVAHLVAGESVTPLFWLLYTTKLLVLLTGAVAIRTHRVAPERVGIAWAACFIVGAYVSIIDMRFTWSAGVGSLVIQVLMFGAVIGSWPTFGFGLFLTMPFASWEVLQGTGADGVDYIATYGSAMLFAGVLLRGHRRSLEMIAQAHVTLSEKATSDHLTERLTRTGLNEAYPVLRGQALRHQEPLFVVFVDVAGLKHVNDTAGHPVGDNLLRSVAKALWERNREGDLTCRWGGDEFVWVGVGHKPDPDEVRERIVATMDCDGFAHIWQPHLWVGVAAAASAPSELSDLIGEADLDMLQRRKKQGPMPYARTSAPPTAIEATAGHSAGQG